MKTKSDLLGGLTAKAYLNLLVKKTTHLHYLSEFNNISLCGSDLRVQVFRGIQELADAAEKRIHVTRRNDQQFPDRLSFLYKGIEFYELQDRIKM